MVPMVEKNQPQGPKPETFSFSLSLSHLFLLTIFQCIINNHKLGHFQLLGGSKIHPLCRNRLLYFNLLHLIFFIMFYTLSELKVDTVYHSCISIIVVLLILLLTRCHQSSRVVLVSFLFFYF